MKKFVIVMISILVLFVFLMLNYLVWDKENLMKQRDTDKIEQDWLRGQNRMLQTTVEELEHNIAELQEKNDSQKAKISDLEQKLQTAQQKETANLKELQEATAALDLLKSLVGDELEKTAESWFSSISQSRLEESEDFLGNGYTLWGKAYETKEYIEFISAIETISIAGQNGNDKPFTVLKDGEPSVITALVKVNASIKKNHADSFKNLNNGANTLEIGFIYDQQGEGWVIKSVSTLVNGKRQTSGR